MAAPDAAFTFDDTITMYAQTRLQTVSDADGGRTDILQELWNRSDADNMVLCQVGLFPASSGGSYSTTGRNITATDPGMPLQPGGTTINIRSIQDVRNFRIQAFGGGTITLVGQMWR